MVRITDTCAGRWASNVATVTPAATETTTAPGSSASAISSSRSGTIAGFTATTTTPAPATARRLAAASASVAYAVTRGSASNSAARAALRLVVRMPPSTVMCGCSSPARMARAIEPAPRNAMDGSSIGRSTGWREVMATILGLSP